MNENQNLKLQAYVDGELSASEQKQVAALVETNAEARGLVEALRAAKTTLAGNEPEARLPETHPFHWSKISREIERYEAKPAFIREAGSLRWWLRYISPAAGFAALALMVVVGRIDPAISGSEEIGNTSPEASSVVFRSQSEGMTVVWLQGDENNEFTNFEFDPTMREE